MTRGEREAFWAGWVIGFIAALAGALLWGSINRPLTNAAYSGTVLASRAIGLVLERNSDMTQPLKLSAQVELFTGWGAAISPMPEWLGSVEQFWEANQDAYRWGDITIIRQTIAESGEARIGGGAEPAFTLKRAATREDKPLTERCPTCGEPVHTIFDHLGIDCGASA